MRKLIIAGGSGFLGRSLIDHLRETFDDIVVLSRESASVRDAVRQVQWDAKSVGPWINELDGAAAIVNFVGRSVDCRKTPANKKIILESRVNSVDALALACQQVAHPPPVWIQSATAHIYGDTHDEVLDESSPFGKGFAPLVGQAWEKALVDAPLPQTRKVILRISFVLGRLGGPLQILSRLARCFLGGRVGSGRQYMSWIHVDDLNRIIRRAIDEPTMSGPYIATAPHPVTNDEFMRTLRQILHRPWSPPVPETMVRFGAMLLRTDPELALYGRRLVPTRLSKEGFQFDFPQLQPALENLLRPRVAGWG